MKVWTDGHTDRRKEVDSLIQPVIVCGHACVCVGGGRRRKRASDAAQRCVRPGPGLGQLSQTGPEGTHCGTLWTHA